MPYHSYDFPDSSGVVSQSRTSTIVHDRRSTTSEAILGWLRMFTLSPKITPVKLDKWLASIWLIVNAKNGISSWVLSRSIGVTQKTAWFMLHRIRRILETDDSDRLLSGVVEGDETYIGGKAEFMHKSDKDRKLKGGRGTAGKGKVQGFTERGGEVRARVIPNELPSTFHAHIRECVEPGSTIYTDQHSSYDGLGPDYTHDFVVHRQEYVRGVVHTNTIEGFWCLLKRMLKGTYVAVDQYHLNRYVSEEVFRYNLRKENDLVRFLVAVGKTLGKRLSYKELIGVRKTPRRGGPRKSMEIANAAQA